jgi:hypothetical protein
MRGQAARACDEPPASEGLKYFNARWYDAGTGRFISEDPARDGVNWYAYAAANPMRFVDPTGLQFLDPASAAVGGTIAVGYLAGRGLRRAFDALSERIRQARTDARMIRAGREYNAKVQSGEIQPALPPGHTYRAGNIITRSGSATTFADAWKSVQPRGQNGESGAGPRAVVIGENQFGRVNPYAEDIGAETITTWLEQKAIEWSPGANKQFIEEMRAEGRQIIDIGPDFERRLANRLNPEEGRPASDVYGSEREALKDYPNYVRDFMREGRYGGAGQE